MRTVCSKLAMNLLLLTSAGQDGLRPVLVSIQPPPGHQTAKSSQALNWVLWSHLAGLL